MVHQGDTDIRSPKRQKTATVQADDDSHENEDNDDDEKVMKSLHDLCKRSLNIDRIIYY